MTSKSWLSMKYNNWVRRKCMFGCKKSTMIIRDANRKCKISFKVLQCLRLPALFCLGNILLSTSAVSVFPSCRHFRFFCKCRSISAQMFPDRARSFLLSSYGCCLGYRFTLFCYTERYERSFPFRGLGTNLCMPKISSRIFGHSTYFS